MLRWIREAWIILTDPSSHKLVEEARRRQRAREQMLAAAARR